MSKKQHVITLPAEERQYLENYIKTGVHSARSIRRASMLLAADSGQSDPAIAAQVGVSLTTVYTLRRRYCQEGLEASLREKPRSGKPKTITGRKAAQIVALACSQPPKGRQRWTLRLLADTIVELELVDGISPSTVWTVLKKTNSSPGKSANGVFVESPANS